MKLKLRENADINTVTGISDIIIDSINKKWDNIRDFNSIIVNLNDEGYEELVPVIESILEDENKNVGKLQQLVELISPTASSIDDGRQEAIDELDSVEVKVEEEMKLDENFTNVSDEVESKMDDTFFKANKDHDRDEKEAEDALKENEKLANETVPKEGETGKKVTSKALKAMHLSESLFDEEDSSANFNIGDRVQVHFEDSPDKIAEIIDIINDDVIEVEEFDSTGSPYRIDRYYKQQLTKLDESLLFEGNNELEQQLLGFLNKKESEYKFKISDDDKRKFIVKKALPMIKTLKGYGFNKEDIIDTLNRLVKNSFKRSGELYTESANVKFDIAREQIKKFKEGKMPKNWTPKDYINDLVSRKHITKEEGDKLLSEDFGDTDEGGIESFRSYAKQAMFKIKEAYTYITNDEQYAEAMHSLIDAQTIIDRLMDEMGNQYLDGEY